MNTKRVVRALTMFAIGFFMSSGLIAWAYGDKAPPRQVAQAQPAPAPASH